MLLQPECVVVYDTEGVVSVHYTTVYRASYDVPP